jgi:hypothetical protein
MFGAPKQVEQANQVVADACAAGLCEQCSGQKAEQGDLLNVIEITYLS